MKTKKWRVIVGLLGCLGILVWVVAALGAGVTGASFTADKNVSISKKAAVTGPISTTEPLVSITQNAGLSGAIFTTDKDVTVNKNIFCATEGDDPALEVYLNGGPPPNAPCESAGLPDGDYYFQVTDPSGSVLLSSDNPPDRMFSVSLGKITGLGPTGNHSTITGRCGGLAIQLYPFDPTPNPGGEYKVWATPVAKYINPIGDVFPTSPNNTFGFVNSDSKTDNFKICLVPQPPPGGGCLSYQLLIEGVKFYDLNTNRTPDSGEPYVGSWPVYLYNADGSTLLDMTFTDPYTGAYSFLVPLTADELAAGTEYRVSEILFPTPPGSLPGGWQNTTGTFFQVIIPPGAPADDSCQVTAKGPDFGNVCLGKGGGLTLGFWSNKNGQALVTPGDLTFLSGLNLTNSLGNPFNPGTKADLKSWLLSANATNMAYMLSAQLAAMELNVRHGVNGNALIYAPGAASANAAGFATVNAIMTEANTSLGLNGYTPAGNAARGYQEALKNALDKANNNLNFVQPGPCPPYTAVTPAS